MKRIQLTVIFLVLSFTLACHAQETAVFRVKEGLYDETKQETDLGLPRLEGAETITVFAPNDSTDHFSNGVCMTSFKGTLYCMWQSSKDYEDSPDTWVAYARSTDNGITWTEPMVLAATIENGSVSSGGWLTYKNELIAYINVWTSDHKQGHALYVCSKDGQKWSSPRDVLMADGSPMEAIIEQDPHRLPSCRIVNAAHFAPGLSAYPIYTDDKRGKKGWHKADFHPQANNASQSRELEPSLYRKPDGTLVMMFRDQKSSFRKLANMSSDEGATWTSSQLTNVPDSRSKQSAGNLPDGTCFFVNNPVTNKFRYPLVLTLSKDGTLFDAAFVLRTKQDISPIRYNGHAKRLGYSYPKSFVIGNYLYISYSMNKEDVQFTRIPLSALK